MSRKKKNNKISELTEALMQDKDITDVTDCFCPPNLTLPSSLILTMPCESCSLVMPQAYNIHCQYPIGTEVK